MGFVYVIIGHAVTVSIQELMKEAKSIFFTTRQGQ